MQQPTPITARRAATAIVTVASIAAAAPMAHAGAPDTEAQRAAAVDFFESRIRPVLVENCYECHSSKSQAQGALRLDSAEGFTAGGDSGPAIKSGKPVRACWWRCGRILRDAAHWQTAGCGHRGF
jgi:hypothetical protein